MTSDDDMRIELARLQEDKACLGRRVRQLEAESAELERRLAEARAAPSNDGDLVRQATATVADVVMENAELKRQLAEAQAENARLNGQIAEWSRQNLAIVALEVEARKRAEAAERQLEEANEALRDLIAYYCEGASLVGREVWNRARAALQDRAPSEQDGG